MKRESLSKSKTIEILELVARQKASLVTQTASTVFICHLCNKKFSSIDFLKLHFKSKHDDVLEKKLSLEDSSIAGGNSKRGSTNSDLESTLHAEIEMEREKVRLMEKEIQISREESKLNADHSKQSIKKQLDQVEQRLRKEFEAREAENKLRYLVSSI